MVEGHGCHRVAHAHRKILLNHAFTAASPNGRFVEGAALINNKVLDKIEVHGKNLFYFFQDTVLHFHFGMSGQFKNFPLPGPEPTATTRLTLASKELNYIGLLSAMTVNHGTKEYYDEKIALLGPDPLREDADKELLWAKVVKTKKAIGLVLMDQSMMAGVGNIYRAEILFKAKVHPETPANSLSRALFDLVWQHSVDLLQRGFKSGSILTVDPEDARKLGQPWTRRYIYNHKQCGVCKGPVLSWDMATRTVYACETCQVPTVVNAERAAAHAAAAPARTFLSHCAPESRANLPVEQLTVVLLKAKLLSLGLDTSGTKPKLVARVKEAELAVVAVAPAGAAGPSSGDRALPQVAVVGVEHPKAAVAVVVKYNVKELRALLKAQGMLTSGRKDELEARLRACTSQEAAPPPLPSTPSSSHKRPIGDAPPELLRKVPDMPPAVAQDGVASAKEAAMEKVTAGENRAVEHVALIDEYSTSQAPRKKGKVLQA
ncbi:MAG: hypothetical protein WDW36_004561 [Sanguina aurantia]